MGFLALLIGLAIVGLVIMAFIAYWLVMIGLIILGIVFLFWFWLFVFLFNGQFIAVVPCAVIATGFTFWAFGAYSDKKKAGSNS